MIQKHRGEEEKQFLAIGFIHHSGLLKASADSDVECSWRKTANRLHDCAHLSSGYFKSRKRPHVTYHRSNVTPRHDARSQRKQKRLKYQDLIYKLNTHMFAQIKQKSSCLSCQQKQSHVTPNLGKNSKKD